MANKTTEIFVMLTEKKVHIYGTWSRAMKVHQRARLMGAKHEYMSGDLKRGDPFKSVVLNDTWVSDTPTECSAYARAEASFGEGA